MHFNPHVKVLPDVASIAEHARQLIVEDYTTHVSNNNNNNNNNNNKTSSEQVTTPPFSLALSGGSTPRHLYESLHKHNLSLFQNTKSGIKTIIGDERLVPADDEMSNYHMAYKALLHSIPSANIYTPDTTKAVESAKDEVHGKEAAEKVAHEFECILRRDLPSISICKNNVNDRNGDVINNNNNDDNDDNNDNSSNQETCRSISFPQLDIVLLGFGADGHTASIFPNSIAAAEAEAAVSVSFPSPTMTPKVWRVTLTIPVITHAKHVIILAAGKDKNWVVRGILDAEKSDDAPVSRFLRLCKGKVTFLLDHAAAEGLTQEVKQDE